MSAQSTDTPAPAPDTAALVERLNALEAEVARQRELIEAQQRALEGRPQQEQPPPADAPAADDAALADLIASAKEEASVTPEEPLLRLYGFADVGLQRMWADDAVAEISPETDKLTFVLGNVNLYLDANPSKEFRFLAEIRFGLFPSGSVSRAKGSWAFGDPIDTNVSDPSAPNAFFTSLRWAGVMPERAHIDWTPSDAFNLRAGLFLTPYGIWNVDHGTPTRIMVSEPLFMSSQLIPSQLIGIEAFGTIAFLPWTLGYHLHVSNGRTFGQVDFSDSKAFGGRLYLSTRNPFPFKIGISGYTGNVEDVQTTLAMRTTNFALNEYAVSGDLSIDVGSLRVRSELVVSWHKYEPGERRVWAGSQLADVMRMGAYLVLAYQLPWLGLEPLAMVEFIRVPVPRLVPVGEGLIMPAVGLNVYFTPTTMLRTQFSIAHGFDFSEDPVDTKGFLYQAVARLITAF
ncbi:MAG TPA: hypothetical protein VJV78_12595 [Polyangiales bacterium]|nr:hypothetical protein [Polyangiales bacterium]